MSTMKRLLIVVCASFVFSPAQAADFFVKASAEYADGTKKEFNCERAAGETKRELQEANLPSGQNKFRIYNINCADGVDFFGLSFKLPSKEDMTKAEFKPYDGKTKVWGDMDTATYTVKSKVKGKTMEVHSFKGQVQQYIPAATNYKVTEFKEETEGAKQFHVIAGEGAGEFEAKKMGTTNGSAGKVTFSFRVRPEFRPARY